MIHLRSLNSILTNKALYNQTIPTEVADRLFQTMPLKIQRDILKRNLALAFKAEAARFDALEAVGFRVNRESVWIEEMAERRGGYYIDVGTSKHIANGDIKVKSGAAIVSYTAKGLAFNDGTELQGDVIVLATGYEQDYRKQVASILGNEQAEKLNNYWGVSGEGEIRGATEPAGMEYPLYLDRVRILISSLFIASGLWLLGGALSDARWNSRFIALQIQRDLISSKSG
jgi:hypothetical protein